MLTTLVSLLALQAPELVVTRGHGQPLTAIVFSADDSTAFTASEDGVVLVWNTASSRHHHQINAGSYARLSADPRGARVLIYDGDGKIILADATGASRVLSATARAVAFAPSSDAFFGIEPSGDALRFYPFDGASEAVVAESGLGKRLAVSQDGKVIVVSKPRGFLIVDASAKRVLCRGALPDEPGSVSISPDGKLVALGMVGPYVAVHDAGTCAEVRRVDGFRAEFARTGALATNSGLFDAASGKQLMAFGASYVVRVANGGAFAWTDGGFDKTHAIITYDLRTKQRRPLVASPIVAPQSLAFTADQRLVVGGDGLAISVWDEARATMTLSRLTRPDISLVTSPAVTAHGSYVLVAGHSYSGGGALHLMKLTESGALEAVKQLQTSFTGAVFAPDGSRAYVTDGGLTRALSIPDLATVWDQTAEVQGSRGVVLSPGGTRVAAGQRVLGSDGALLGQWSENAWPFAAREDAVYLQSSGRAMRWRSDGVTVLEAPDGAGYSTSGAAHADALIAVGYKRGDLLLYRQASLAVLAETAAHAGPIEALTFSPDGKQLASAGADGAVKLWSVAAGRLELLVTLFVFGNGEWVCVAPDGRFDGSPGALPRVHFVQGTRQVSVDAMTERFFTPGLLALVAGVRMPATSAPPPREAPPVLAEAISAPPTVRILAPKNGEEVSTDAIEVELAINDNGGGADDVRLFLNGKRVDASTRGLSVKRTSSTSRTFSVVLSPGDNELRAVAFNRARVESDPATATVRFGGGTASASLYVLSVGVNEYKNAKYNLNYGRPDAQAIAKELKAKAGRIFKKIEVSELYDRAVSAEAVVHALEAIAAKARPIDVFVFYFAGHGTMSEGSDAAPPEFFLVPHDVTALYGDDAQLAAHALSAGKIRAALTAIAAQKQLILLDACQAGGALDAFAMRGAQEERALLQLARSAGIVVMAATGSQQLASEVKALGHGVFTYALIEGLRGAADGAPKDGKITVKELEAYLSDRVPALTKRHRGSAQYPNSFARGQDFPISTK